MLTELKKSYERLVKSDEFKHKGFLCGAFLMCEVEETNKAEWQIDFYNKDNNTITTYTVGKTITATDDEQVFKEEKAEIEELKIREVKVDFDDLKQKLDKILSVHNEIPIKITIILQNLDVPKWNIIYITKKFNLLNIKINAVNGNVLEEKIVPLLSFERGR